MMYGQNAIAVNEFLGKSWRHVIISNWKFDKMKMMFESINSGITEALNKLSVLNYADISKNTELVKSAIKELEDILARIQITDQPSITEAKCIAYILKLNQILGNIDHIVKSEKENKKKYKSELDEKMQDVWEKIKTKAEEFFPNQNTEKFFEYILSNVYQEVLVLLFP